MSDMCSNCGDYHEVEVFAHQRPFCSVWCFLAWCRRFPA